MEFSYLNLPLFTENNFLHEFKVWLELKKLFSQTYVLLNKKKILNSWSSFLLTWLKQTTYPSFKTQVYLTKKQFLLLNMGFSGGFNFIKKTEQFLTYQYDLNNAYITTYNYYFPFKLINFEFLKIFKKCNLNQIYGFFWVFNFKLRTYQLLYINELKTLCLLKKNKNNLVLLDGLFYLRSKILYNFFTSLVQNKQKNIINKFLFKVLGNYLYGNLASNKLFLFVNFYNNQKQLRPVHLSFATTAMTRLYLLNYLIFYFKTTIYTDTDSLHCSSPINNKFLKNKIFFFKQVYKIWTFVLCSFYFAKKIYSIFYINLNTFYKYTIIKYKGLNYETQNFSFFQTKKLINFSINKNKIKLSYKLLRNWIN